MQEESSTQEQLLCDVNELREKLEELQREKTDLQILLETTAAHSDTVEAQLLGQAESVLRESEERFRAIAEATPVPMLIARLSDNHILYANAQMSLLLGLPVETLIGRSSLEFYGDRSDCQTLLDILAESGCVSNREVQAKKADGTTFWVMVSIQPLTFGGQPAILSAFHDLTQRKEAEQALRQSEQLLRRQSLALLQLGRERTFNSGDLNAAIREITEVAAHTLEVERVSIWLYNDYRFATRSTDTLSETGLSEGLDRESENPELSLGTKQDESPHSLKPRIPNLKLICLDRFDRRADRHLNRSELPTQDVKLSALEAGIAEKLGIFAHPEMSLHPHPTSDLPLVQGGDTNLHPLWLALNVPIRLGGQIIGILSCEHIGSQRQWLLEERTFADSLANLVALSIEGYERRQAQQALAKAKQELEITVEQRTAQLKGANKLLRFEIAERKRAEIALQEALHKAEAASRAKSTFLANMSHELRTPLNAIIGYSEILEELASEDGLEDLLPDIQKIRGAGKHLLTLINDILDLSKIEAGRMELYLENFDLAGLIGEVVETLRPLTEKNQNRLEVSCSSHVGQVYADLTKVRQILFNLLSNALKFTEEGTVRLTVTREQGSNSDWVYLCVADTGIGMSAEQQQRLFEVFSQGDASTTRKYGGTGLGLAISRRFCQMMGGDITVESQAGVGSTFTVHLKARVEDKAQEIE